MDGADVVYAGDGLAIPVAKLRRACRARRAQQQQQQQQQGRTPLTTVYTLLLSGSFNPLHKSHVECLETARRGMEAQGYPVAGGFIVPSSELYVNQKLGRDAMPLAQRVECCRRWAAGSDWVDVLDWGWASGSKIRKTIDKSLARLNVDGGQWDEGGDTVQVVGILVFGADHIVKAQKFHGGVCCVGRRAADTSHIARAMRAGRAAAPPGFFFVDGAHSSVDPAHSSTAVRAAVKAKDAKALAALLPAAVLAFLYPWAAPGA